MLRFGEKSRDMREMHTIDVFFSRIKLLVIMSKAYLRNYPMGEYRKEAVIDNARLLAREAAYWKGHMVNFKADYALEEEMDINRAFHEDHVFHESVRLLSVMATAFAEGTPVDHYRRKALQDTVDYIETAMVFNLDENDVAFLKVA
ncbi:hypothetical protein ACFL7E_09230 [Thermodesulfobacteriota bacterium]